MRRDIGARTGRTSPDTNLTAAELAPPFDSGPDPPMDLWILVIERHDVERRCEAHQGNPVLLSAPAVRPATYVAFVAGT